LSALSFFGERTTRFIFGKAATFGGIVKWNMWMETAPLKRWIRKILFTSSTQAVRRGSPKGILHTSGGYLLGAAITTKYVFDLKEEDVYWCTADIGWVTGHSYVVYGPLCIGATVLMYEGAPNWPEPDRFWDLIEEYRVNILYTAPTAIRE